MDAAVGEGGVAFFRESVVKGAICGLVVCQDARNAKGQVAVLVKGAFGDEGDSVVSGGLFDRLIGFLDYRAKFCRFDGFDRDPACG